MSRESGRGGMGMHKHAISGTPGQNRRGLQALGRFINRLLESSKRRPKEPMFSSISELFRKK